MTSNPGRIAGISVPSLRPANGAVQVVLCGEAPGPLGADRSGIPFWGDRAGVLLYRALARAGRLCVMTTTTDGPVPIDLAEFAAGAMAPQLTPWDGARFSQAGIYPLTRGAVVTNAFPQCPTDDGRHFRKPTRAELISSANVERLRNELSDALKRSPAEHDITLITIGAAAYEAYGYVLRLHPLERIVLRRIHHCSSQGLLSAEPNRGKGCSLTDLQIKWVDAVVDMMPKDCEAA